MRLLTTIGALVLFAVAAPAIGRAATPPDTAATPEAAAVGVGSGMPAPGCRCPRIYHRHVWRRHWRGRFHVRRRVYPVAVAVAPLPPYDPPIPAPWDTAYDRAMTLHFRSPVVSGTWTGEPGFAHTPAVFGIQAYRVPVGPAVMQYDGLIGDYVPLAQADARRAFPLIVPVPPAPIAR